MKARILVILAGLYMCAGMLCAQQAPSPTPDSTLISNTVATPAESRPAPDTVKKEEQAAEPATSASAGSLPADSQNKPNPDASAHAEAAPEAAGAAGQNNKTNPIPVQDRPYVIGCLDVLEVRVWNDPKLSGMYSVRPDGMISIPLIGEFKADGLTVPALTDLIHQKLLTVINDPNVNIQVVKINSKRVFIFGGVQKPGEMPLYENMTVLDALSNVGFKDFANLKKIRIMRGNQTLHFNYKEASQGKHMEQNIYLQNGDRIFVPE